jgi:hypothetical protein
MNSAAFFLLPGRRDRKTPAELDMLRGGVVVRGAVPCFASAAVSWTPVVVRVRAAYSCVHGSWFAVGCLRQNRA